MNKQEADEIRADVRALLRIVETRTRFRDEHPAHAEMLDTIRERWIGPSKRPAALSALRARSERGA